MAIDTPPFRPDGLATLITCTTAGAPATAIYSSTSSDGKFLGAFHNKSVRITASGTSGALIAFGGSGVTVTSTTGMLIPTAVSGEKFGFGDYSHIAAMAVSGTSTLIVNAGAGAN